MNEPNEDEDLERLLRGMSLQAPPPALDRRVASAVRRPAQVKVWLAVAGGVAAGVAIALAGMRAWPAAEPKQPEMVQQRAPERLVVPSSHEVRMPKDEPRAEPVCFQRVYKAETDLGIVGERGNLPVRRIDRETLRDVILYDPEHDRTIRWTTPERVTVLQITEPY